MVPDFTFNHVLCNCLLSAIYTRIYGLECLVFWSVCKNCCHSTLLKEVTLEQNLPKVVETGNFLESRIATQLRHLCSNISSSHTFIKENHQTWKVLNQTKFSGLEGFKHIFIGRRILEYYYHTKLQKYIYKNTTINIMFHRKYLWSL